MNIKTFDEQKAEYNVKELDTFDEANYENITDAETSDSDEQTIALMVLN